MTPEEKETLATAICLDRDRSDILSMGKAKRAINFVNGLRPLLVHEYLNYMEGKDTLFIKIIEALHKGEKNESL